MELQEQYSVVLGVPIADEKVDVGVWLRKRNRDDGAVVDDDAAVTSGGALQEKRREVEEASDLVLDLEAVGPIPPGRDRAVCAQNPVVPAIPAQLYAAPDSHIKFHVNYYSKQKKYSHNNNEDDDNNKTRMSNADHVNRRGSSKLLCTLTVATQLVVTFMTGPGN